jgi:predicted ABC-type ATPase
VTEAGKQLVIVAGPNGSGKTTLVRSGALSRWFVVPLMSINADDVAREFAGGAVPTDAQSLAAAQHCDAWLDRSIERGESVVVETVLSSAKLQPRVLSARAAGFTVILVFVSLRSPALNVGRVRQRTQRGGHPVPEDRILRRRQNAHANFGWFARHADLVMVYDNTDQPTFAAGKLEGAWTTPDLDGLPHDLRNELLAVIEKP